MYLIRTCVPILQDFEEDFVEDFEDEPAGLPRPKTLGGHHHQSSPSTVSSILSETKSSQDLQEDEAVSICCPMRQYILLFATIFRMMLPKHSHVLLISSVAQSRAQMSLKLRSA